MPTLSAKPNFLRSSGILEAVIRFEAAVANDGGVLISGEVGTGRELMARAIHRAADEGRRDGLARFLDESTARYEGLRPFVVVDCASSRECEDLLFGRCSGAKTDGLDCVSTASHVNRAMGGTLFLRQLHEMPIRLQLRLARILRDGELWVDDGTGARLTSAAVRLIASTDVPTGTGADERLAPELQRRLSENQISLPPLRERRDDMPGLVRHLLEDICETLKLPRKAASRQAVALLTALPWRRNSRELKDLLHTLVLRVSGRLIRVADILLHVKLDGSSSSMFSSASTLKDAREQFEREYVAAVLQQHHGRMAEAAKALGIQRTNLYRKVRQLSVDRRASRKF